VSKQNETHGMELAGSIGAIASDWAKKNKQSGIQKVRTRPVNGSIIEITFEGLFSDERKECIKEYLLGPFKKQVAPIVRHGFGSVKFRISRCPRDKSDQNYCWFIQKR